MASTARVATDLTSETYEVGADLKFCRKEGSDTGEVVVPRPKWMSSILKDCEIHFQSDSATSHSTLRRVFVVHIGDNSFL